MTLEPDADDKATYLAALLYLLGHPYRVVLVGGSSVKIQTREGDTWMDVEW